MEGDGRDAAARRAAGSNSFAEGAASSTGKMAFLPRLRRQEQLDAAQAAAGPSLRPSMADRLAQMRIEDRRRARNEELRSAAANVNPGGPSKATTTRMLRPEAVAFYPSSTNSSTNMSASSRAGSLYYSAAQLARQDVQQAERESAVRRKFAGPAPPSSWQSSQRPEDQADESKDDIEGGKSKTKGRRALLRATRRFFDGESHGDGIGMSLVDSALIAILQHISNDSECQWELRDEVCYMPSHLKERCLALSGRLARTRPMSDVVLHCLFREDDESKTDPIQRSAHSFEHTGPDEDREEREDELPDAWDVDSSYETTPSPSHLRCSVLDLSFAQASSRAVRSLLKSFATHVGQLQALSLAGWGAAPNGSEKRVEKSLRTSSSLFNVLDQMVNLQKLSLAASKLLPGNECDELVGGDEQSSLLSSHTTSEAIAFLRKLSRRTSRLTCLDLTATQWVSGAVIANVGWYSTSLPVRRLAWPQLTHLILTDCPAFGAVDAKADSSVHLRESGGFAGAWHAAHHGSAKHTQSPYFLAHKPGLGRALLAHGVESWNIVSGRNTLVDREAAALARHGGHVQSTIEEREMRSAFDDDNDYDNIGARSGFAIAHGVAPFGASARHRSARDAVVRQRIQRRSNNSSDDALLPRCPVSGSRVAAHEWERARVLDAVRGRWGSAILGTLLDEEGEGNDETDTLTKKRASVFTSVYF